MSIVVVKAQRVRPVLDSLFVVDHFSTIKKERIAGLALFEIEIPPEMPLPNHGGMVALILGQIGHCVAIRVYQM